MKAKDFAALVVDNHDIPQDFTLTDAGSDVTLKYDQYDQYMSVRFEADTWMSVADLRKLAKVLNRTADAVEAVHNKE